MPKNTGNPLIRQAKSASSIEHQELISKLKKPRPLQLIPSKKGRIFDID